MITANNREINGEPKQAEAQDMTTCTRCKGKGFLVSAQYKIVASEKVVVETTTATCYLCGGTGNVESKVRL